MNQDQKKPYGEEGSQANRTPKQESAREDMPKALPDASDLTVAVPASQDRDVAFQPASVRSGDGKEWMDKQGSGPNLNGNMKEGHESKMSNEKEASLSYAEQASIAASMKTRWYESESGKNNGSAARGYAEQVNDKKGSGLTLNGVESKTINQKEAPSSYAQQASAAASLKTSWNQSSLPESVKDNGSTVGGYAEQVASIKTRWNDSSVPVYGKNDGSAGGDSQKNSTQQVTAAASVKTMWADLSEQAPGKNDSSAFAAADKAERGTSQDDKDTKPFTEDKNKPAPEATEGAHMLEGAPLEKADVPTAQAVDEDAEILRIEAEIALARAEGHRAALEPADVVDAIVVETKEQEPEQHAPKKKRLAAGFMVAAMVVVAVVVVVVVVVVTQSGSSGSKAVIGSNTTVHVSNESLADAPPPGMYKCFHNSTELQGMVDLWMSTPGNFKYSPVYGPKIKYWCVSKIQSFDHLFSIDRNPALANFNADLAGWDVSNATSMTYMFSGARSFLGNGLDLWNTSRVTNLEGTFQSADLFNVDLSSWDVSKVVSMTSTFESAGSFRGLGLDTWKPWQCLSMTRMLRAASSFDTNVEGWDVSRVVTMDYMFSEATSFLGNGLNAWDVSRVQNMTFMFNNVGTSFDFDASGWDVSNVIYMKNMFSSAQGFRGVGLEKWNVSKVQDMSFMFNSAYSVNVDLSSWDVRSVTTVEQMFFSDKAFNQDLCNWGNLLSSSCNTAYMFYETSCPQTRSPSLTSFPPGPFCQDC